MIVALCEVYSSIYYYNIYSINENGSRFGGEIGGSLFHNKSHCKKYTVR